MMRCNQCRHELPDGSLFCDACGASLMPGAPDAVVVTPHALPGEKSNGGGLDLDSLARAEIIARQNAVSRHDTNGASNLRHTTPAPLQRRDLTPATPVPARSHARTRVDEGVAPAQPYTLRRAQQVPSNVSPSQQHIRVRLMNGKVFDLTGKQEYLIGRRDPAGQKPDVDLADWNGAASGVSRQHAKIHVTETGIFIEDLESLNETIRNGYRLLPHQQYPLEDGDELRLGSISVVIAIA